MTPEQRYLFDLQGFLHLESALSDAELSAAQNALSCLESIPDEDLASASKTRGLCDLPGLADNGR